MLFDDEIRKTGKLKLGHRYHRLRETHIWTKMFLFDTAHNNDNL